MSSQKFWVVVHGGSTHFPVAMVIASFLFDLIAYVLNKDKISHELHMASFYSLMLGALGSFPAVISGLMLSNWEVLGSGALRMHHFFVWPAFGLIVALAVWRLIVRDKASRPAFGVYLIFALVTTVIIGAAGYWGGEI